MIFDFDHFREIARKGILPFFFILNANNRFWHFQGGFMKVIFWGLVNVLCLGIGAGIGWIVINAPECMYFIFGVLIVGCVVLLKEDI